MEKSINALLSGSESIDSSGDKNSFTPLVYDMSIEENRQQLEVFLNNNKYQITIYNSIENQILELYKIDNPNRKPDQKELNNFLSEFKAGRDLHEYGVWVYYPWRKALVHLLPKEDFIRLRTSRNQYKITPEEQNDLASKKIGLIGLSVGQSVALTLSMERVYGTLRIADFDSLDLSNLNRIRSGVQNLGLPKTSIVAREIAEIDPFLKVEVFKEGITNQNLDSFLGSGDSKLDLLIEECDSLDIKIKARLKARALGIPVIMDTSDRGMMDIERFDLEPKRALMHGMVDESRAEQVEQWTAKERLALVMDMVGAQNISARLKASLLEVEESVPTWPQLASSVALGGALSTIVSRQILLGEPVESGRFYLDADDIYRKNSADEATTVLDRPAPLTFEDAARSLTNLNLRLPENAVFPAESELADMVEQACLAPTGGNVQPWKWVWKEGFLALFHDQHFSVSFLDYRHRGSYVGLGAAMENLEQRAKVLGYTAREQYRLQDFGAELVAVYSFEKGDHLQSPLSNFGDRLAIRLTNRLRPQVHKPIPAHLKTTINEALAGSAFSMTWLEDAEKIDRLAQIIGKVERQRILDPQGHKDFINEARWTEEQAEATRNGVDLRTLELSEADKVGFKLIQDDKAITYLRNWDKGTALIKMSTDAMKDISALALLHTEDHSAAATLEGGKWIERIWLFLNANGIAYQPVSPATFMFERLAQKDSNTSPYLRANLLAMREEYMNLLGLHESANDLFLCRLFFSEEPKIKSLRKPLSDVYRKF